MCQTHCQLSSLSSFPEKFLKKKKCGLLPCLTEGNNKETQLSARNCASADLCLLRLPARWQNLWHKTAEKSSRFPCCFLAYLDHTTGVHCKSHSGAGSELAPYLGICLSPTCRTKRQGWLWDLDKSLTDTASNYFFSNNPRIFPTG